MFLKYNSPHRYLIKRTLTLGVATDTPVNDQSEPPDYHTGSQDEPISTLPDHPADLDGNKAVLRAGPKTVSGSN